MLAGHWTSGRHEDASEAWAEKESQGGEGVPRFTLRKVQTFEEK